MKNHWFKKTWIGRNARASAFAALAQLTAGAAMAGEREDALALCRQAIAEDHQVSTSEHGDHFRASTTNARAYTMRFDLQTKDGAPSQLLTCKVKRGALVIAELSPKAPNASVRSDLSDAAEASRSLAQ